MNLERFHALAKTLSDDISAFNYEQELVQLAGHLLSRNSEPGNSAHATNADKALIRLREELPRLPSTHRIPPAWNAYITEYHLDRLVGAKLIDQIMEIFQRHAVTPTMVASEIMSLAENVKIDRARLANILESFKHFGVEIDVPEPGACEMGYWIPRQAIQENMIEFGEEVVAAGKLVKVFEEIATGSAAPPKLHSLSTSDYTFIFSVDSVTCAYFAGAIAGLIQTFKNILEIRKLIGGLQEQKVPKEDLARVSEHADQKMADQIEIVTEEVISKANGKISESRKNELRIQLRNGLTNVAIQIDQGYNFEVRATPNADKQEDTAEGQTNEQQLKREQLSIVLKRQGELNFLRPVGSDPILSLPTSKQRREGSPEATTDKIESKGRKKTKKKAAE